TPLLLASQYGHIYMVKLLLEQDYIDINVVANNYKTPIFAAAKAGNLEIVELLLMRDDISTEKAFRMAPEIDVNAKDLDGYTALHLAASYGLQQIVRILLERSDVNVNVRTNDGKTPLHVATESDYRSQVKYL
ncbi:ankyrin repeat-containing domain protein, partial [Pyronema domesticum]